MSTQEERESRKAARREGENSAEAPTFAGLIKQFLVWTPIVVIAGCLIRFLRFSHTADLNIYLRDAEVIAVCSFAVFVVVSIILVWKRKLQ